MSIHALCEACSIEPLESQLETCKLVYDMSLTCFPPLMDVLVLYAVGANILRSHFNILLYYRVAGTRVGWSRAQQVHFPYSSPSGTLLSTLNLLGCEQKLCAKSIKYTNLLTSTITSNTDPDRI